MAQFNQKEIGLNNGKNIVVVLLGCETKEQRFVEAVEIYRIVIGNSNV